MGELCKLFFSSPAIPGQEKRRPSRRQPNDHDFGSLIILAVTAGAFLLATWGRHRGIVLLPPGVSSPLKATVEVFAGLPLPFFLFRDLKESPSSRQQWPPRTQLANRGRLA
jgi:hypothetical protein